MGTQENFDIYLLWVINPLAAFGNAQKKLAEESNGKDGVISGADLGWLSKAVAYTSVDDRKPCVAFVKVGKVLSNPFCKGYVELGGLMVAAGVAIHYWRDKWRQERLDEKSDGDSLVALGNEPESKKTDVELH